ncbi:O-Antigen ligase [Rubripirellula amarantea]|uniref:O-Antigen ligase n=1 Tax=Rubripirellula amarantea TaxID=2527999 RepID=A0A5C5WKB7_9BACT|nr:O-antigen ligase family protein [Rubripirellula amarantea]TWT51090.1 O-Antigen ligase [Rubripirellula amarantea]
MAKRRVVRSADVDSVQVKTNVHLDHRQNLRGLARHVAAGWLGGLLVYVAYHTGDSIAVEQGSALWLSVFAFAFLGLVAISGWSPNSHVEKANVSGWQSGKQWWLFDIGVAALAAWMMMAAFASSSGNLRMATNEAWLWVAAAAIMAAARRVLADGSVRRVILVLAVVIATGLAVEAIYQDWISIPASQAEYRSDPDRVLKAAGVDAPPQSSLRMVFENRLFDGGPSATFALANSLAAVLLVGAIVSFAVLRSSWKDLTRLQLQGWSIALLGCLSGLLATRSRSALVAMILGATVVWVLFYRGSLRRRAIANALLVSGAVGVALVLALAAFGNPEWFDSAPLSLEFRLQYWRSTWQMVLDHPLFGCGPGNFQAIYDRYREASTTEQIADPHNFIFETLASGGLVGLGILTAIAASVVRSVRKRRLEGVANGLDPDVNSLTSSGYSVASPADLPSQETAMSASVWIGSAIALFGIWAWGWITRQTPDFSAAKYAIPIAVWVGWSANSSLRQVTDDTVDRIFITVLFVVLLHLSAAGGFTVPGVAMFVWVGVAALARPQQTSVMSNESSLPVTCVSLALLVALMVMSLSPVSSQHANLAIAEAAIRDRINRTASDALQAAVDADRWGFELPLYQSEFLRMELIRTNDDANYRQQWETAIGRVLDRAGENPSVYRQLGVQRLHVYQVFGRQEDLNAASELIAKAYQWAPASVWLAAQSAEIAREQGDLELALELADRASSLAQLGENLERQLWLQQIYVASPLGKSASSQAVRDQALALLDRLK